MTDLPNITKERDPFFDSLKFVLIMLVVVGHVLQSYVDGRDQLTYSVYTFIYMFHMPLFVFISGFFSKNVSWNKSKKGLLALIVTLYLFQFIHSLPAFFNGEVSLFYFLLEPRAGLWYIMGLILWRFFFCFVPKAKGMFPIIFALSLAASLILGFKLNTELFESLRVVTLFPYFVLGYYCPSDILKKIRNWDKLYVTIFLIFAFLFVYNLLPSDFRYSLYGTISYKVLFKSEPFMGMIYRMITIPVAILLSCAVMNVCTTKFAKYGNRTLEVYIIHIFLVYNVYTLLMSHFGITPNLISNIAVAMLIIVICVFLSRFTLIQFLVDPVGKWQKMKSLIK